MDKELIDYFIERTDLRFDKVDKKLEKLVAFRWQIIGGSTVLSIIFGIGVQFVFILYK